MGAKRIPDNPTVRGAHGRVNRAIRELGDLTNALHGPRAKLDADEYRYLDDDLSRITLAVADARATMRELHGQTFVELDS